MLPRSPLYLMIKPPPPVARDITGFPETDRRRGARLLHCTMQPLGDRREVARQVAKTIDALGLRRFRLVFDQLAIGRGARLISSERLRGAEGFHATLIAAFARAGIIVPQYRLRPHITLNYRDVPGAGTQPIDPISWEADEMILVESVHGQTRHEHLKCWPLG